MIDQNNNYTIDKAKAYEHQQAARNLFKKNKILEGIEELKKAIRYDPVCPNHFCNIGYYYMEINQGKEAVIYARRCYELIDEAIKATGLQDKTQGQIKDFSNMLATAGSIMEYYGDPNARRCLETAVRLNPKNWGARYNLGLYYLKNGLTEHAINEFEAAYKFNKHYPDLITVLAYSYNDVGMIEESISVIDAYKQGHPLTEEMLYILADNYYGLGRDSEVMGILKEVIEKNPNSAFAHAALGEVYAHAGWEKEAYDEIMIAKSLNKIEKDQDAENIIKKVLNWLDDPDDDNNTMLPVFLLLLLKKKMLEKRYSR